MENLTIGIEIEMTGITRKQAARTLANYFGTTPDYIGGAYDASTVKDRQGRTWKVMSDGSLRTETKNARGETVSAGRLYSTEVVSPILTAADIPTLQEAVRKLRKAGAFTNDSCGIHIHIGAAPFTPAKIRNLINLVHSKEDLLYKALAVKPHRESYCKKIDENFLKRLNSKKPKTMAALADLWYAGNSYDRHAHYNSTRYHGINLHATFTKGTIEFRLFNSTLHAGKIKAYIQFCIALASQALTQRTASPKPTETDNEKYTFRCWLLRMGLIGDEYKTCRTHLLANLRGNSAWRYAA